MVMRMVVVGPPCSDRHFFMTVVVVVLVLSFFSRINQVIDLGQALGACVNCPTSQAVADVTKRPSLMAAENAAAGQPAQ